MGLIDRINHPARNEDDFRVPYMIAEAGVNHEGSMDLAYRLIDEAKEGGADAIKFQTYRADKIASKNSPAYWDTKKEITKFYKIAVDIKNGEHGTQLTDAIYGSSVGFKGEAIVELEKLSKETENDPENILNFRVANFENRIYSVTKC